MCQMYVDIGDPDRRWAFHDGYAESNVFGVNYSVPISHGLKVGNISTVGHVLHYI
jgi:hypothetical protein